MKCQYLQTRLRLNIFIYCEQIDLNIKSLTNDHIYIEFNRTIHDIEERGYDKCIMAMVNQRDVAIGH